MIRRITLPLILLLLGYGFWISTTFKDIAAGVAIFLFGMLCMELGFKALSGFCASAPTAPGKAWVSVS